MIEPYLRGVRTLGSVAAEAGLTLRTAQRWVERYRKDGFASLARKERTDQGGRRAVSSRMVAIIEGLALEKPRIPVAAIYREVKEFGANFGEPVPSYPVVYRIVRAMPSSLLALAHEGGKVYGESYEQR